MMYYFSIFVTFLLGSCLSEKTESVLHKQRINNMINIVRNTCQKKMGLDTEILDGLRRGEFPDNPKLKCYVKCVMKILHTMRNGKVDLSMIERSLSYFPDRAERANLAAKNCIKMAAGEDYCKVAFNFLKCTYEEDSQVFFFP